MTQFSTPTPRRASGELDVYTGLLCVAFLVLAAGVFLLATRNIQHSATPGRDDGSMFKLVNKPR
jgi:hypothetical protein